MGYFNNKKNMKLIDLRSDTVTKPSIKMRKAMLNADVGDDVFNEDTTINKLESIASDMLNTNMVFIKVAKNSIAKLVSFLKNQGIIISKAKTIRCFLIY